MDKKALRREFRSKRDHLSSREFVQANQQIWTRLKNLIKWESISAIHIYLPIPQSKEIPTEPLVKHVRKHYPEITLVVPKVAEHFQLEHFQIYAKTKFDFNAWGIPEPLSGQSFPIDQLDLAIVPLLAFDHQGHRLGYGKGFYDRFLAECSPDMQTIGLSLFPPIQDIPVESTDVPLTTVVTPDKVFQFS